MDSATNGEDIQAQKTSPTTKPDNMTVNGLDKARQIQAPNGGWRAWLQVLGSFLIFCVTWFAQFESSPYHHTPDIHFIGAFFFPLALSSLITRQFY